MLRIFFRREDDHDLVARRDNVLHGRILWYRGYEPDRASIEIQAQRGR